MAPRGAHKSSDSRGGSILISAAAFLRPLTNAIDGVIKRELKAEPFQRDPAFVQLMMPLVKAINLYFGTEIRGWEHVPRRGPVLIVGNHSGGAETSDIAPIFARWVDAFGPQRPLYALGYDLLFAYPIIGSMLRRSGLVPAKQRTARRALQNGAGVVVFPGGDYEVFRPWAERNTIEFAGRTGFIKLALATGVPVVPMITHGAHQSTIVMSRGRRLARAAGLDRLHIKIFPFIWNIPFGLTPAFVPSVQLPAKVTVQFAAPMNWSHYGRAQSTDPVVVHRCYAEITQVMQDTLDALARERPHPILTRLNELRPSQLLRQLVRGSPAAPRAGATPPRRRGQGVRAAGGGRAGTRSPTRRR